MAVFADKRDAPDIQRQNTQLQVHYFVDDVIFSHENMTESIVKLFDSSSVGCQNAAQMTRAIKKTVFHITFILLEQFFSLK
jgi:hypothetical protein